MCLPKFSVVIGRASLALLQPVDMTFSFMVRLVSSSLTKKL